MYSHSRRPPGGIIRPAKRRGMLLALTLFVLALAAALIVPLAGWSGLNALQAHDRLLSIQQDLTVESVVAILPELLERESRLREGLDRQNLTEWQVDLGPTRVELLLQDDSAKLPLSLVLEQLRSGSPVHPLLQLQVALGLPALPLRWNVNAGANSPEWRSAACLEDAFEEAADDAIYGRVEDARVWSRFATPRSGLIHARRADPAALEAALVDIAPGLGARLAGALRAAGQRPSLDRVIDQLGLDARAAAALRQRFTAEALSYSLLVRITQQGRVRQCYLLVDARNASLLAKWEVAP